MKSLFILLICVPLWSSAQTTYFNKRINSDQFEEGWSVLQDSDKYVAIAGTSDSTSLIKLRMISIDSVGNLLWTKSYESPTANYFAGSPGSFVKTFDNGFVVGGGIEELIGSVNDNATIFVFNNIGDTLWTSSFGDTLFQTFYQCKQTRDSGYIACGVTTSFDIYGDALLVKFDKSGNVEWSRHYGFSSLEEDAESVIQTNDGGYFIGGFKLPIGSANGSFMVIKTDSVGNIEWRKFLGGPYEDACLSVLETSDGNLVGAGYTMVYDSLPHGGLPYGLPYIAKFDSLGNLLWESKNGPVRFEMSLYQVIELPDGSLVGAGANYDDSTFYAMGIIEKVSANGDSLWYKTYRNLYGHTSDNGLYGIAQCSDQGFIAVGPLFPSLPDTGGIDTWFLKIDSMGCDTSNCWTYVKIDEDFLPGMLVKIFPNPVTTILRFQFFSSQNNKAFLKIFNGTGQEVMNKEIKLEDMELNLDEFRPGIYFVCIRSEREIITKKIVKY